MLNAKTLNIALTAISATMREHRDYLIELDQRNGDGDLGISMDEGFRAAVAAVQEHADLTDLGKLMLFAGKAFNTAAPSSLGTIVSQLFIGMAKALKGNESVDTAAVGNAMTAGLESVMKLAGSKPGEKTVLDALVPAAEALVSNASAGTAVALKAAAAAARAGSDNTANMKAVHGRAAYYAENSLGVIDGGSIAAALAFESLATADLTE